jgi:hypothetical protein
MTRRRVAGALFALCLGTTVSAQPRGAASLAPPSPAQATLPPAPSEATLFRVFLKDGSTLVSFGEVARVGDRVVFSMPTTPTSSPGADQGLHLVNLSADKVDWDHTARYADSARASQYLTGQALYDYAKLSNEVADALNQVAAATDPATRLAIVQKARKTLAEWPPTHFNYKQDDVKQMLTMLDEAIADLRLAVGSGRFDLNFVSVATAPVPSEPLMPEPTAKESIEQVLTAAKLTDSSAERSSLLTAAMTGLAKNADALPADWAATTAASTMADIAREVNTDRAYQTLTNTMLSVAKSRTRAADVRGLQQLMDQIRARDEAMGAKRPEAVNALLDSVSVELDAARRLQLARDQWALRAPAYRAYRASVLASLTQFAQLKVPLENIKALAGSSPYALSSIQRTVTAMRKNVAKASPPDELQEAHALLVSAVELADSAAKIRREAALTASMTRAWDASAAAAGSLMLFARAKSEIQDLIALPQLPSLETRSTTSTKSTTSTASTELP